MKFVKDALYFMAAVVCVPLVIYFVTGILLAAALPGAMVYDYKKRNKMDLPDDEDGTRYYRGLWDLGDEKNLVH